MNHVFRDQYECQACDGYGEYKSKTCAACHGTGIVNRKIALRQEAAFLEYEASERERVKQ